MAFQQDFTFDFEYRPGTKTAHVDSLSRNPLPIERQVDYIDLTEANWILAAQLRDERLSRIKTRLAGVRTSDTKQYFDNYIVKNGKVYRRLENGGKAWAVPRNARIQICMLCHDDAGYLNVEMTLERVKQNYWFAGMRRFITKYVNTRKAKNNEN